MSNAHLQYQSYNLLVWPKKKNAVKKILQEYNCIELGQQSVQIWSLQKENLNQFKKYLLIQAKPHQNLVCPNII